MAAEPMENPCFFFLGMMRVDHSLFSLPSGLAQSLLPNRQIPLKTAGHLPIEQALSATPLEAIALIKN
jgi:hypothetical protein